ncbi:ribonuclease H-like domain-containing protein [Tanacetum coccineum]
MGVHNNNTFASSTSYTSATANTLLSTAQINPTAFYSSPVPLYYPTAHFTSPVSPIGPPPGFGYPTVTSPVTQQAIYAPTVQQTPLGYQLPLQAQQAHSVSQLTQQVQPGPTPVTPGLVGPTAAPGQATTLPYAFTAGTLHDPASSAWNMDTVLSLSVNIRGTNVLDIQEVTCYVVLFPHAFLVSQHTWHQRLGHPGGEELRRLVSSNFISYNKEKPLVLCHACQLGKHVRVPFVNSSTASSSCFDIIHSDVWTSPILSLSGKRGVSAWETGTGLVGD